MAEITEPNKLVMMSTMMMVMVVVVAAVECKNEKENLQPFACARQFNVLIYTRIELLRVWKITAPLALTL